MSLQKIQAALKAPKGQTNNFGKYKYRSCEDIVEAVKPILAKYSASLTISDDIVMIGDRYYVKALAVVKIEGGELYSTTAFAREPAIKKGMDEAQITGATSSYARKYALNGLFAIDDTPDADTQDNTEQTTKKKVTKASLTKAESEAIDAIHRFAESNDTHGMIETYNELTQIECDNVWAKLPHETQTALAEAME